MVRCQFAVVVLVAVVTSVAANDRPVPPKKGSRPPIVVAASARANRADGKVVVHFSLPGEVPDGADYVAGPEQAPVIGTRTKVGWYDVDVVADGKIVRAFTADGKPVEPSALPKRLSKPSRVVLFYGTADPDPFYLGLYRDEAVLFVAPADKFQIP